MKGLSIFKQIQLIAISFVLIVNPFVIVVASNIESTPSVLDIQSTQQNKAAFKKHLQSEQQRLALFFDKDELLLKLDFETDKIIDFVTNNIAYQAYDGVLRGVKGTLIGRSGNSHDQAITLASLLKDAGLEAQTLMTSLSDEQANELNTTIASAQLNKLENKLSTNQPSFLNPFISKLEEIQKANAENLVNMEKETLDISKKIFEQIPEEQVQLGKKDFNQKLLNSSKSYRWVRYRMSPTEEWSEAHPAYKKASNWNLKHTAFDKEVIDPKDVQQVSVEAWIENSKGEKHSISGVWKKPAANLLDHTLTLEFGSDAMANPQLWGNQEELFKKSYFFYLQIDGTLPKEGKVFDLSGNIYSGDSLAGLNTIFATMGKKAQQATDSLSGLSFGKSKDKIPNKNQLTKVWLEFTLDKPNSESTKIERVIYQGKAREESSSAAMKILQRWDVNIATTTPMQQYYQHKKIESTLATLDGITKFHKYINENPQAPQEQIIQKYTDAIGNPNSSSLINKRVAFDYLQSDKNTVSYVSEPNLIAVRHGLNKKNNLWSVYEMTDIITNQRWSFEKQNSTKLSTNIQESIKHGVWQTRVESSRLVEAQNTIYTDSAFTQLAHTNSIKQSPEGPSNQLQIYNSSKSAWWQIDTETGSTIGMSDLGYGVGGSEISEETLLQYIAYGISGAFFVVGSAVCIEGGGGIVCCLVLNGTLLIAGLLLGAVLGLVSAMGSSIIGIGVDLGATMVPNYCE